MSTTTLFVELLIIGLQACVWLLLVVCSTAGVNSIYFLAAKFGNYATLAMALVFALAYVLGIFFDKLATWLIEESWGDVCCTRLKKALQAAIQISASKNAREGTLILMSAVKDTRKNTLILWFARVSP